ncbi:MAG TPA: SMC-Scp complex subunit ScpB [Patescibacteria group bacterium]|nr:SMC-Scp complex subunit ScpB [Patescibacteria group bacterium]
MLPFFATLPAQEQRAAVEALIFAADEPLSDKSLFKILILEETQPEVTELTPEVDENGILKTHEELPPQKPLKNSHGFSPADFEVIIADINLELENSNRPYRIVKIAGGYQFATTAQHGEIIQKLIKSKSRKRLSQAALETLAIIAYRQPITKPEIEAIRGVSSSEVVNSLIEKNLVAIAGRSESIGKPLLYGTTEDFLKIFGLHTINDLPKIRELDDLMQQHGKIIADEMEQAPELSAQEIRAKMLKMFNSN